MTSEEAIKKMESMKQTFIDLHTPQQMKKKESKRVMEAYDMAIKALELEDVLDKIIDEVCDIDDEIVLNPDSLYARKTYVRLGDVLEILNKYKAESGVEE